ncbi:conserved hypothetical protein [Ricinus communis]|uniref:Uncharacterized protein n=1 Tax=Ricinus communis TaxID=3988 RepID=B9TI04_RICCO|nr:conserved hypothetical protein [Ricinus communis]
MSSNEKAKRAAASSIFPSLFFAAIGALLAQLWVLQLHGSLSTHLIVAVPGGTLTALALYRARLHWLTGTRGTAAIKARDMVWFVLLAGVGMFGGFVISAGSMLWLALFVGLMYLIPWANIAPCREHSNVSFLTVLLAAVSWLAFHNVPMRPLHYLVVAWMLLVPPTMMLFLVLLTLDRDYRVGEAYLA